MASARVAREPDGTTGASIAAMGLSGRAMQAALALLPPLLYALILGCLFLPLVTGARTLFAGDIHQHYLPWEHYASQELQQGNLPTWDRGLYMGHPLFAEGQAAVFYPVTRLWYAVAGGGLEADIHAFNLDVLCHWVLAGWGVFVLASVLGLPWRSAFVAGLLGCLAGQLVVLPVNVPLLRVAAWTGFLLAWGVMYLRTGTWPYWIAAVITWTLTMLAGGPQMVALLYLAAFVFGLLSIAELKENPRPALSVGLLLLSPVVAAGLAAVQLIPTMDLYKQSAIAQIAGTESLNFSASWTQVSTLLFPPTWAMRLPGQHPLPSYIPLGLWIGTIGSLCAMVSLFVASAPLRLKVLLGVLLLFALGANTPVYPLLLEAIPALGAFRAPDRFLAIAVVPLAVLAGFGLEALLAAEDAELPVRKRLWVTLVILLVAGSLTAYALLGMRAVEVNHDVSVAEGWWTWTKAAMPDLLGNLIIGGLLAAATYPTIVRKLHPSITLSGAAVLGLLQFWLLAPLVPPLKTLPMATLTQPPPMAQAILDQMDEDPQRYWGRVQVVDPIQQASALFPELKLGTNIEGELQTDLLSWYHGAGSEAAQTALLNQLHPNAGNLWGLEYAGGIASLYSQRMDDYLYYMESAQLNQFLRARERPGGRTLMDQAGIGYFVLPGAVSPKVLGTRDVGAGTLGLNARARPLAYIFQPSAIYPETKEALEGVVTLQIDPGAVLILDSAREPVNGLAEDPAVPTVRWFWEDSATLLAEAEALGPSYLIFNQQWMPGWRATVNGRGVPLHRAWGVQLAVPVKAGPNRVVFKYVQPGYRDGLQVSIVTLLGLCVAGLWFSPAGATIRKRLAEVNSRDADKLPVKVDSETEPRA